jgi:SAM-dependent methyltransferase
MIPRPMAADKTTSGYALGYTDAEHARLIYQAARLAPLTERLFREAGIASGQRVLDIGSGMGDVAMLAAMMVGPSGEVVGIERDPRSIARARVRAAEAGLRNVTFHQSDASQIPEGPPFDAAVGRLILQYIPDPVGALRSVSRLVRPGGVLAFQEPTFAPYLRIAERLPLWFSVVSLVEESFRSAGANTEVGLSLHTLFEQAGLPPPAMHMDIPLGTDRQFVGWICDLLFSLQPQAQQHNVSLEKLGDLTTLSDRLRAEVAASKTLVTWIGLVSAWTRKPSA